MSNKPINEKKRHTTKYQKHEAISVAYKVVSRVKNHGQNSDVKVHTGEDSVDWLLEHLKEEEENILKIFDAYQGMNLSEEEQKQFEEATQCYLCHNEFTPKNIKVRDHDHLTGAYRGAAHNSCNLKLRQQYKIPVFFHNFKGYDSHLLVWGLAKEKQAKISVIGQGLEKYLLIHK